MDKSEHLKLSSREQAQIHTFMNQLKEDKLRAFLFELFENNELEYITQLAENKIPFYEELNSRKILNKIIEDISNSPFKLPQSIKNIEKISLDRFSFIKEIFVDNVVKNILEIEIQKTGSTIAETSPFYKKTLELGLSLLLENHQYVDKFKKINIEDFAVLVRKITLENNLSSENMSRKKLKV